MYVKATSLERDEVADFIRFMLDRNDAIAEKARFVGLSDDQLNAAQAALAEATE